MSISTAVRAKETKLMGVILACLFAVAGYAQQAPPAAPPARTQIEPAATPPANAVILKAGEQKVTLADFDALLALVGPQAQRLNSGRARRSVAEQYGLMLVLAQQAEKDKLDSSPSFLRQVAFARLQSLARAEYDTLQGQANVTPDEVSQYYTAHQPDFEEALLRQVIFRKRAEGAKEGSPGIPAAEARTAAESVRKGLQSGTDWKNLEKESKSPTDIRFDSEPRPYRHGQLPADWEKIAFQLKQGETSEPLENPQVIVVFQSAGNRKPEMKEVAAQIESNLKQQKVQTILDALKQKYPVWLDEDYFGPATQTPAAAPPKEPGQTPPTKP